MRDDSSLRIFQYFCGEEFCRHPLPFDRSSLTLSRQRMGEDDFVSPAQEGLAAAAQTGAAKPADVRQVIVDATVKPKSVMFPTGADLTHRAQKRLGVDLRQTYERVGRSALIKHQRSVHATQLKRGTKAQCALRNQGGQPRICGKIDGDKVWNTAFTAPLSLASGAREQRQRQRGRKVYSLHAPEVGCINRGKVRKPHGFDVKAMVAVSVERSKTACLSHTSRVSGQPAPCSDRSG